MTGRAMSFVEYHHMQGDIVREKRRKGCNALYESVAATPKSKRRNALVAAASIGTNTRTNAPQKIGGLLDEMFANPRDVKLAMDVEKLVKELQTNETYSTEKILEIIEKKVRENLEVQLTMNLDVSDKELTKFLENKWDDYYNLIMPFLCLALNMNGINQRRAFFYWFAEELLSNDGVLTILQKLLLSSFRLRNMMWILKMNILIENLGYPAQKNFLDYLDLISNARLRTVSWSPKQRETILGDNYLSLSSPRDKEGN